MLYDRVSHGVHRLNSRHDFPCAHAPKATRKIKTAGAHCMPSMQTITMGGRTSGRAPQRRASNSQIFTTLNTCQRHMQEMTQALLENSLTWWRRVKSEQLLQLLTRETGSAPLKLNDMIEGCGRSVRDILKDKHPSSKPPHPDVILSTID